MIHFGIARKRRRGYGGDADRARIKDADRGLKAAMLACKQAKEVLRSFEHIYDERERERERQWAEQLQAKQEAGAKLIHSLQLQYASAKDLNDRGELEDAVLCLIHLDLINQTHLVASASQEPSSLHRQDRSSEHQHLKALYERALANVDVAEANLIKANDRNLPKVSDVYIDRSELRIRAYEDRCLVFKRRIADARDAAVAKKQRGSKPIAADVIHDAIRDGSANTEPAFNVASEPIGQTGIIMGTNDSTNASSQVRVGIDPAVAVAEDRCSF